jgi:hypothetical protein
MKDGLGLQTTTIRSVFKFNDNCVLLLGGLALKKGVEGGLGGGRRGAGGGRGECLK